MIRMWNGDVWSESGGFYTNGAVTWPSPVVQPDINGDSESDFADDEEESTMDSDDSYIADEDEEEADEDLTEYEHSILETDTKLFTVFYEEPSTT